MVILGNSRGVLKGVPVDQKPERPVPNYLRLFRAPDEY